MSQENNSSQARHAPQRPRRRRRSRGVGWVAGFALLYIVFVIGVSVLLACIGWIAANDVLALNKPEHNATLVLSEELFTIEQEEVTDEDGTVRTVTRYNADVEAIAGLLEENDLIEYTFLFRLFAWFTHGGTKMRPGAYNLNTDMDYRALIAGMGSGSSSRVEVEVTIPEGYTVAQIFQLLEDKGVASVKDLEEQAATYDYAFSFLQGIPLGDASRLEGFLFPDTYKFYVNHDVKWVLNKLLQNFDAHYPEEMRQQVAGSGYTLQEILTVASLIERETDNTDRRLIASVIYNRLNNPDYETVGLLQIDATLYYLTGHAPTEADKSIDSPYNTYMYPGLPPGPIANPGQASLEAALEPESTKYYYYALGDDSKHHFFQTYDGLRNWMATQELYK